MKSTWRTKYERHIRSAKWSNMRDDMMRLRGRKCETCGQSGYLYLHHKTYERLGKELIADLELLCTHCHEAADKKRARQRLPITTAFYNAGLDTYASKKYGDDWDMHHDYESISEEFDGLGRA